MLISKISRESVFRNLLFLTISNVLLQLLGFLYRVLLSRLTGAEGMGLYQLVMPFYSLLSSLTLTGLTVAVSRTSAACFGLGDRLGARATVGRAFRLFSFLLIICGILTFFFRKIICGSFLGDIRLLYSLPFLFICLFLTGFENILKNYFYGVDKVSPQITSELSEQVIRAVSVCALLVFFHPENPVFAVGLIILGMIISELSSALILHIFFRFDKKGLSKARAKPPTSRELFSIALPVSASAGINNLLAFLNSALIPQRLCAAGLTRAAATESFGIVFGMAMPLLSFPIAFIASLTSVMVPRLSSARAKTDFSDMRRKAAKTIHSTSLLAMPLMAVLIPLARPLITLIFSHDTPPYLIFPLCISTLISYYEMSLGALLNAIGKQKISAFYIIIGGVIQLIFTWLVGIPELGLVAFAIGGVASGAVCAILQFICLCRTISLVPRFSNWFLSPLLAATLSALLTRIIYMLSGGLFISATCGIAVYCISLSALGTNPIRYIKTLIPKNER